MMYGAIYPIHENPHCTAQDMAATTTAQPAHVEKEDGTTTTVYWTGAERGEQ
jgi:hypothetical protein